MTQQHVLELIDFPVYRGGRLLIKAISFCLPHGRYVEIQGQNGCGKTSLLRTLAFSQPRQTDQSIFYFGHQTGFRSELKVIEQLTLSLEMYGASTDVGNMKNILKRVGLSHQTHIKIQQLSQGQIRRLMLAVMAHSRCTLWLIDEPFNALDLNGIHLLQELLIEHFEQNGSAVIATHRTLSEAISLIDQFQLGKLHIESGQAQWLPATFSVASVLTNAPSGELKSPRPNMNSVATFNWILKRELKLMMARPQDIIWPAIFYWMTISLFPFGIGNDIELLADAAAGIFWVSALLAILMGATRCFDSDFETGSLNQLKAAEISFSLLVLGKVIASWCLVGIPLALTSIPLGLLYGLSTDAVLSLCASLLLGSISLTAFSSVFAALGLMARQAQILICVLAFPVFVPILIFGTAAMTAIQHGISLNAPITILASSAVLCVLALPVLASQVLSLALE